MELKNSHTQLKEKELGEFEKKYGVSLPDSFKQFYLKWNGGSPSHSYINGHRIVGFMPIKYHNRTEDNTHTIEWFIHLLKDAERLPNGFIPFGSDGGGWHYAIDLNTNNYGVIYVLPNGIGDHTPIFIASCFDDFIRNLSIEDDY